MKVLFSQNEITFYHYASMQHINYWTWQHNTIPQEWFQVGMEGKYVFME